MSIQGVSATFAWIQALFIRSDGERLLLGGDVYPFVDSQQHFSANNIVNDVIELQGSDGAMLAGQVKRASTQDFDGHVANFTNTRSSTEEYRREFIAFFGSRYSFTVVYIDASGTAIQRRGGYLVDAPEVKEIVQKSPEYHVALGFEDPAYYDYNEDDNGNEVISNQVAVYNSSVGDGGAYWGEET